MGSPSVRTEWLTFSLVPASANPSNKLTTSLLEDVVPHQLQASNAQLLEPTNGGRVSFCVPATPNNDGTFSEWTKILCPYGVRSLRLVVCECKLDADEIDDSSSSSVEDRLWKTLEDHLPRTLPWNIYEAFGNQKSNTTIPIEKKNPILAPFELSCRRWSSFGGLSRQEFSSTRTKAVLRTFLLETYEHQIANSEFTLLLYGEDNTLRLEWTLLAPPKTQKFTSADYLPKPGCKRVEAWMLMKNLQDLVVGCSHKKDEEVVVLDPLCGKGTFLVEAATTWKIDHPASVSFVGIDASETQLEDALCNVQAVAEALHETDSLAGPCYVVGGNKSIRLLKADCRDLASLGFEDGSVTAIATCPPFGRQFFALGDEDTSSPCLATAYHDWLREWVRVLDPNQGRIALLVDVDHREEALNAIRATQSLRVRVVRESFRIGKLHATVIVADAAARDPNEDYSPSSRFPWEGTTKESRAEWSRLRTAEIQELVPYTKVREL